MRADNAHKNARALLRRWARSWNAPIVRRAEVSFDPRLRTSWGRCDQKHGRIRLNPTLADERGRFAEALCHEAAHLAVHARHGADVRPHGPEWRELVSSVGFAPRARLDPLPSLGPPLREANLRYEHRCPVCQFRRLAKRPVPQWRCVSCLGDGLDGLLEIRRMTVRKPH